MLNREKTNTNFIVFGLTYSGLEPMIYHSRGEHANHYTTDAVVNKIFDNITSHNNTKYSLVRNLNILFPQTIPITFGSIWLGVFQKKIKNVKR